MIYKIIGIAAMLLTTVTAHSQVSLFTQHQVLHLLTDKTSSETNPTGDYPYLGQVGIEYERNKFAYSLSFIHRSNVDLDTPEYNYNGVALGVKYTHCVMSCK